MTFVNVTLHLVHVFHSLDIMHETFCSLSCTFVRMFQWNETNQGRVMLTLLAGKNPLILMDLTVGTHRVLSAMVDSSEHSDLCSPSTRFSQLTVEFYHVL